MRTIGDLCECGCGEPATLAKRSNARLGHVKGQPVRFILGHFGRSQRKDPAECSVDGCDRKAKARGLCEGHRKRAAKRGMPGGPLGSRPPLERALDGAREVPAPARLGAEALPCWIVQGNTRDGRLRIRDGDRKVFAYRVVFEALIGALPEGLVPDHLCRRPACVNPWHLDPVPDRVNVARGIGPTAINARKTVCKSGHPLSGDNVRIETTGSRRCRTCFRNRNREYMRARRVAA